MFKSSAWSLHSIHGITTPERCIAAGVSYAFSQLVCQNLPLEVDFKQGPSGVAESYLNWTEDSSQEGTLQLKAFAKQYRFETYCSLRSCKTSLYRSGRRLEPDGSDASECSEDASVSR